jgi:uncharacterized protein (TIGR02453 family)
MSFSPKLLTFLADLAAHNDRDWFAAHKDHYEDLLKTPALSFITAFEPLLHEVSPHFQAIAKAQGGSLFRIYRDTRFGADKSPYKTHLGIHFRHEAGADAHAPGFYLHVEPGASMGGFGLWMPDNPSLARIRDAMVAQEARWADIRAGLDAAGFAMHAGEGDLKRVPAGYPKDHVHAEDLKRKSFAAMCPFTDAQVVDDDLLHTYSAACRQGAPLLRFLCEAVGVPF